MKATQLPVEDRKSGLRLVPGPLAARASRVLAPPLLLAAFFLAWQFGAQLLHQPAYILPKPSQILHSLWVDKGLLAPQMVPTIKEILIGFGLATVVAQFLGFVLAHSPIANRALYPLLVASQTVPIIAIAPVLLIWFGYGILPKVIVTALICFFPLTVNTVVGYNSVDDDMRHLFKAYRAGWLRTFWKLELPSALPYIFAGLKISITLSVIGATIGEWIGADKGLGYIIVQSGEQILTARLFAALTLLSVIGVVLFVIVVLIERLVMPWQRTGVSD